MADKLQLRLDFNPLEDRILLRILGGEDDQPCTEYRLWITRRFVFIFTQAIDKLVEEELSADMQVSPESREAMRKFQQEAALSKADFSTSFKGESEDCKLFRETPLLVTTLKIKKNKSNYTFSLLDNNNVGTHLTSGLDVIITLQKMLMDSARKAGWNRQLFEAETPEPEKSKPDGFVS